MNLIKKNIILVIVMSITLILAGVMIFFVIQATGKMKNASTSVAQLRDDINKLNQETPAPKQENLNRIENDYKYVQVKVKEILPIFGTPYRKPIEAFAKELGKTVPELKKEWRKTYRTEIKKGGNRTLIFVKFISKFDSNKLTKATQAFATAVKKSSLEIMDETNINGAIMEALGLPRKMDEISCKTYIRKMQINVLDYMKSAKEGEEPFTFKDETAEKLSFEKFEESMPRPDEVPFIFKHWRMVQDLCMRLKGAKVEYLDSIARNNLLKGNTKAKKFLVFSYILKVDGPLNSIRALLNSMMDAYKEDKIYVVKSVKLETKDEAASIMRTKVDATTSAARPRVGFNRRMNPASPAEERVEEEEEDVNVQILGVSDKVSAEIKFDYIVYIGEEIKGK